MGSSFTDFPNEVIQHLFSEDAYKPMANLIRKLQKKEFGKSVFASTSHCNFLITLESEYRPVATKNTIIISFDTKTKFFDVGYYDVKSNVGITYRCIENQAESLVDAFVLRMFLTENNEFLNIEAEETPTFQIGQHVETILDHYSRKYHKGVIFEIVKHHQQNRFMYFIEENGKKLKKRYFKDNLRVV